MSFVSIGIVTVEPGGLGLFVSRNNDYIYRRTWERVDDHLALLGNTDSMVRTWVRHELKLFKSIS